MQKRYMSERKLKTAILGLEEDGELLLKAASESKYLKIVAVADRDYGLVKKTADEYKCAAYDDYRQLIIQNQLDCLLVGAGLYSCAEYVRMGMKKKFNVLKLPPVARTFEEAAEFVRLAETEKIKFAIANTKRLCQSFLALRQFLQDEGIEQVFLLTAVCNFGGQAQSGWHFDPKLSGGGVLLRNSYDIIDQIVWNFGTPKQVYSLNTNTAGDRQQRLYLTEDTAVVTMNFTDAFFANLTGTRIFGPREEFLRIYGKDKILTVDNTRFVISDSLGQVSEEFRYGYDRFGCLLKVLEDFALGILSPDKNKLCGSGSDNLAAMAVIESAYLSARTSMPEDPGKILKMASRRAGDMKNI